jgi:hypothetical protein
VWDGERDPPALAGVDQPLLSTGQWRAFSIIITSGSRGQPLHPLQLDQPAAPRRVAACVFTALPRVVPQG